MNSYDSRTCFNACLLQEDLNTDWIIKEECINTEEFVEVKEESVETEDPLLVTIQPGN